MTTYKTIMTVVVGALLFLPLASCGMPDTIAAEQTYFDDNVADNKAIYEQTIVDDDISLNYVSVGPKDALAIVFIHGTPGDWRGASRYLMDQRLNSQFRMVSYDRPGWGDAGSLIKGKKVAPTFSEQTRFIKPLLEKLAKENNGAGSVLVGHSLGASIAPSVAIAYPELVSGLVLLSGSLNPKLGKPRWYNRVASNGLVSFGMGYFAPELLKANREIMQLRHELKIVAPQFATIEKPVTVIQGLKDKLVYPGNIDFAETAFNSSHLKTIRLPEAGHFTLWENRDSVTEAIGNLANKILPKRHTPSP